MTNTTPDRQTNLLVPSKHQCYGSWNACLTHARRGTGGNLDDYGIELWAGSTAARRVASATKNRLVRLTAILEAAKSKRAEPGPPKTGKALNDDA